MEIRALEFESRWIHGTKFIFPSASKGEKSGSYPGGGVCSLVSRVSQGSIRQCIEVVSHLDGISNVVEVYVLVSLVFVGGVVGASISRPHDVIFFISVGQ